MSINSSTRKAGPYTGNAAQTAFAFAFKVFQAADVLVVLTDLSGAETPQTLTSQYTVSLNANQDNNPGGSVTMLTPPPTGFLLTLGSQVAQTQGVSLTNGGGFFPQVVDDALDRLTILVQQNAEEIARAVKTTFSSTVSPDQLVSQILAAASTSTAGASAASASATAAAGSATAAAASAATAAASSGVAPLTSIGGTANAITASAAGVTAYRTGQIFAITPASTNNGTATLNVNGLGVVAILKQGSNPLAGGDLVAGAGALLQYDGTQFQLLNPDTSASTAQAQFFVNARTGTDGTLDFRNRIINGSFRVNQSAVTGTVTLAAGAYGHDGWKAGAAGCTYTFSTSGNTTILNISSGSLQQVIEDVNIEGGVYALSNQGTAQARIAVSGSATSGSYAAATSNSPLLSANANAGGNVTVEFSTGTLDRVQLEPGTLATTFERRPFSAELVLCQRYFEIVHVSMVGVAAGAGQQWGSGYNYKVTKHAAPGFATVATNTSVNVSGSSIDSLDVQGFRYFVTATAAGTFATDGTLSVSARM